MNPTKNANNFSLAKQSIIRTGNRHFKQVYQAEYNKLFVWCQMYVKLFYVLAVFWLSHIVNNEHCLSSF